MRLSRFALLAVLSISLFAPNAWAQSATATILGHVTDPQGAAVARANITVTNTATQVVSKTQSDSEGNYRVPALPIGTYVVTAEHEGFSRLVTEPRTLQINQDQRMDLHLVVGTKTETVEVSGVGTDVETVNPTLGESVTSRTIVNMPLNGRNVLSLALLQPGVTEDNPDDTSSGQGFNIGGGRTDSVTYLLDGGLNNDLIDNGVVLNPNPDTIAEFRILTSNYTAEYGRNGAGIISVVTKSGTNQIHGSAFDFVRNTDFDANAYFNKDTYLNVSPLPRNDLKRHQYGATIGGPISIPHLIDGKDRYFFFVGYQGQRQVESIVESGITTFTPAELGGDFSQAAGGSPDPNVAAFLQANPYFQSNPTLAAQAIIDPTTIDPAAQNYISTFNLMNTATSPTGVFSPAGKDINNNNELTIKLDFNFSTKDKLSVTLGGYRNPELQPFGLNGADILGFPADVQNNEYFANFAYTRTFSPALLNEFRFTAQRRYMLDALPPTNQTTSQALGFGILSDLPNGPPLMTFDTGLSIGQSPQGPAFLIGDTFAYSDTLTWIKGANTWKFGAGFSAYEQNTKYDYYGNSSYGYAGYNSGGDGTGNSLADFLVGAPNNLFEGANAANDFRSKSLFFFGQDEWRVRK
ncbi:MAG: carboxypeptidase regulatory-like domain-containing protein, partial [Terriglobales bacterium]